uniref:Uncharacterized protein n=1 Tax=Octopus bimaculoides TaxID=37653 RepID=A0A0L8HQ44_OCTBM
MVTEDCDLYTFTKANYVTYEVVLNEKSKSHYRELSAILQYLQQYHKQSNN